MTIRKNSIFDREPPKTVGAVLKQAVLPLSAILAGSAFVASMLAVLPFKYATDYKLDGKGGAKLYRHDGGTPVFVSYLNPEEGQPGFKTEAEAKAAAQAYVSRHYNYAAGAAVALTAIGAVGLCMRRKDEAGKPAKPAIS